jgi:hypothetical protein
MLSQAQDDDHKHNPNSRINAQESADSGIFVVKTATNQHILPG